MYHLYLVLFPGSVFATSLDPTSYFNTSLIGSVSSSGFGLFGENTDNFFGFSATDVGDVNSDGYDDLLIGEYGFNDAAGRALLLFGNSSGIPSLYASDIAVSYGISIISTIDGNIKGGNFAYSVSGGGDWNNDSFPDILISGHKQERNIVYVIWGTNDTKAWVDIDAGSMDSTVGIRITHSLNGLFGEIVTFIGDFNGDGVDDFIATAKKTDDGLTDTGSVFIFFGRSEAVSFEVSASNTLSFIGSDTNEKFGWGAASAGDVNGDGLMDIVISRKVPDKGRVFVLYGNSSYGTGVIETTIFDSVGDHTQVGYIVDGIHVGDALGSSVAGGCDFDNDGLGDVIFSAPGEAVYIVFGNESRTSLDLSVWEPGSNNGFKVSTSSEVITIGDTVGCLGDIDGDGFDEFYFSKTTDKYLTILYGKDAEVSDTTFEMLSSDGYRSLDLDSTTLAVNLVGFNPDVEQTMFFSSSTSNVGSNTAAGVASVLTTFTHVGAPTTSPTFFPSTSPTVTPTVSPTFLPSLSPSISPTVFPSASPSTFPSSSGSQSPTGSNSPSVSPTFSPSVLPTHGVSETPTIMESLAPSDNPSSAPSLFPSASPTFAPSIFPSSFPTEAPSTAPTIETCVLGVTTTALDGVTWKVSNGDDHIVTGEFSSSRETILLQLVASDDYTIYLTSILTSSGTVRLDINGESKVTFSLDSESRLITSFADITCNAIRDTLDPYEDFSSSFVPHIPKLLGMTLGMVLFH